MTFLSTKAAVGPRHRSSIEELAMRSDGDLARLDPLVLNLMVARGIPRLAHLESGRYQELADRWAEAIRRELPSAEAAFHRSPGNWKGDLDFFRLGVLCWFVDEALGIRYREDQRDLKEVAYTDPSDLFLNGVIDTRRGTCANMAALHVALGWRLGWPVSLACAGGHVFCRFDDGRTIHNIEATNNGRGGFHSHPDDYYRRTYSVLDDAIRTGSDLTALDPRRLLGLFVGFRARHWQDIGRWTDAQQDYVLALRLFPNSHLLRRKASEVLGWGDEPVGIARR
jgi:Transglutaminase-like superfamily